MYEGSFSGTCLGERKQTMRCLTEYNRFSLMKSNKHRISVVRIPAPILYFSMMFRVFLSNIYIIAAYIVLKCNFQLTLQGCVDGNNMNIWLLLHTYDVWGSNLDPDTSCSVRIFLGFSQSPADKFSDSTFEQVTTLSSHITSESSLAISLPFKAI